MIRLMQGPFPTEEGIRRRPAFDGMVECPVHGHADLEKCTACSYLVEFEGEDQIVVVCGYPTGAPQGGPI
ncbi:MAG TPA: hypothetical protein VGB34_02925 [Candidatus Limnocylindria bacterium]|jgi:hypothetical protein